MTTNYAPNTSDYGTDTNPVTGNQTSGVTYNAPDTQNPYGSYSAGSSQGQTQPAPAQAPAPQPASLPSSATGQTQKPTTAPVPETGLLPRATPSNPTPQTEGDIQYEDVLKQSQGLIDSINQGYSDQASQARSALAGSLAGAGLGGSTAAASTTAGALKPILDARNQALSTVYQNIQATATADAATARTSAEESIKALAANQLDWNSYKQTNPDNYQALVTAVGGDPNVADAMFAMNAPAETVQQTWQTSDGNGGTTINQLVQDPTTGKNQVVKYDIPGVVVPQNWTSSKIGTNSTLYTSPDFNTDPSNPNNWMTISSDPTNNGAITVVKNGVTTVNGIPVNNNQSSSPASASPQVAAYAGVADITAPLSSIINNVNVGLGGIVNAIIKNEGGSPKGVVNNPGNIKVDTAKSLGLTNFTDSGVASSDGGDFASFTTAQDGTNAIGAWVTKRADEGQSFQQAIDAYTGTGGSGSAHSDFGTNASAPTPANQSQMYITANGVNTGITNQGIYEAALDYASDQKLPPTGIGSSAQAKAIRTSIVNKASALVESVGLTLPQYQALYGADKATVNQNIQRLGKIDASSQTLTAQFPRLAALAAQVGTNVTEADINSSAATVQEKFGSGPAAQYIELIQTIRSDYANLQAGVGGGRGGQYLSENASSAIPAGLTPDQYTQIEQTIQQSAENSKNAIQNSVSTQFGNLGGSDSGQSTADSSSGNQISLSSYGSPQDFVAAATPNIVQQAQSNYPNAGITDYDSLTKYLQANPPANLPPGSILVLDNDTGELNWGTQDEVSSGKYTPF